MKIFSFVLLCFLLYIPSHAEDLDTVWTKQYIGLTCVKFTPDGKRILGAYRNSILEISTESGDTIRKYETFGQNSPIISMGITKDGKYVFSRNSNGRTYGWNTITGKSLLDIGYHDVIKNEAGFCVHPTENKVYFCYGDTISLFDIESNKTESVHFFIGKNFSYIAASKDNKYLALSSSYYDNSKEIYLQKILLVDAKDFSIITELKGDIHETLSMDFSNDSKYLTYLSSETSDNTVNIYDITSTTKNRYYYGHFNFSAYSIKYINENNLLLVSGRDDIINMGKTAVLDNIARKVLYTFNYGGGPGFVDVSPNNQIIVEDKYALVLVNNRWFTTSVPSDPRIKMNGNMKIKYVNEVLSLDNTDSELIKLISIFDINGKLVKTYDDGYVGATVELPFAAPAGVYLVRIVTDQSDYNFKFVRE